MAGWTCKDANLIEWNGDIKANHIIGDGNLLNNLSVGEDLYSVPIRGASFDGVDDYVEIPHHNSQLGANLSNGFTISAWINPRSAGESNAGIIIDKSSGWVGVNGFGLLTVPNQLSLKINNGTERTSALLSITYRTWQHILITISSAQLANFYINGVLSGTANQNLVQTISTITTTNAPRIGNESTTTDRTFDGIIKDVKMWNRVLTAAEIAKDYAGINISDGQILYVPLEKDYTDKAQYGLNGTNSGSVFQYALDKDVSVLGNMKIVSGAYYMENLAAPATYASGAMLFASGGIVYGKVASGSIYNLCF